MEYYSAIKKNETMPFAAIWVDLDIIILSELSHKKTNGTNEPVYKTETESQM